MDSFSSTRELQERLRQQEVVANLGQQALETDELDQLMHNASAAISDTLDTEYCSVLELLSDGDEIFLRQGSGWQDSLVGTSTVPINPDSQAGYTLITEEPVIVEDLHKEDRFSGSDLLLNHAVVSGISVVIGSVEDPWGVLGTYTTEPCDFTDHDAAFVQSVANILASVIENVRTRSDLEMSEQRYRGLVENFPNGAIALIDEDLRYSIAGGTPVDKQASSGADLTGLPIREAISEDLADILVPRFKAALDGDVSTFEYEHDGTHAQIHTIPLRDDDGQVFAAMGVSQDITQREQTEQELAASEERFRSMMEQSPFSMQIFDAEGQTITANPAWERLWDASRDELADYNILQDEQLEEAGLIPSIRDAFDGEVVELPVMHYDPAEIGKPGRDRWIEGYVYPLSGNGQSVEVALVHHDITDRKNREQELQRIRERMEFALTATDAVVWDWDIDNDRTSFYPSAKSLYGTIVENWEDFLDVVHPEDRAKVQEGIKTSLETSEPKHEEIRIIRDGEVRWIEAPGQPVSGGNGSTRMVGVARDITERKTYEQKLEESNERLEQFAHAASHDLQEPLRMVSTYLQLVEQRYAADLDEDGTEFIEFAVDGADRMREMIEGLLAYSRVDTRGDSFKPVDLDDVLAYVQDDLQVKIEESDATLTAGGLPTVQGDGGQLRQVFQNLLDNAIEYSGDDPPQVHVGAKRLDGQWKVSVSDEGIGIDSADTDRIFEVFQSLHGQGESGTGIGLAVVERIVERHGGEIWVDSAPGEGATFSFALPVARETDG